MLIRRKAPTVVEQIVSHTKASACEEERVEFLPSGSLLLNLAASQKGKNGGWARGRICNPVGDGSSGKTLLCLEACAQVFYKIEKIESKLWPKVKNLSIVYNNIEGVMDMPLEEMYGDEFVDFVEWIPDGNEERDLPMTCEAFGRDLLGRIDKVQEGDCLIYVLDSIDALDSKAGLDRMEKSIKTGKELDGTYGTEKAKYFSSNFFNNLCSKMAGKDVTIFMISQVRHKIDAVAFGEKYYRTGGKALDFYTHQVPWLAQVQKLTNEYKKEKRVYGVTTKARFKRNKVAKPFREVEFDILFDYGIDDIGTCANFLSMEEIRILSPAKSREDFIEMVEEDALLRQSLFDYVEHKWFEIEENTKVKRKNRWED